MKPILPKGLFSFKVSEEAKQVRRIIAPPGATILVIPSNSNRPALQSKMSSIIYVHHESNCNLQLSERSSNHAPNSFMKVIEKEVTPIDSFNQVNVKHQPVLKNEDNRLSTQCLEKTPKKGRQITDEIRPQSKNKKLNCNETNNKKKNWSKRLLLQTKTKLKPHLLIEPRSSSDGQRLSENQSTSSKDCFNNNSTFMNEFEQTIGNYIMKSKENCKLTSVKSLAPQSISKVESGDVVNLDNVENLSDDRLHSIVSTRSENPPSYEAHFCQSPPVYINEISGFRSPSYTSSEKSFSNKMEDDNKPYLPPYFSPTEDHYSEHSSNEIVLKINANNQSITPQHLEDYNSFSSKLALDQNHREINSSLMQNICKTYPIENINQESCNFYLNCCDEEPKDYSNYSENSSSQLRKKELDTLEYITTFTDGALAVIDQSCQGNGVYQKRQKQALDILNNLSNNNKRKQILKDNFWIVEDEPLNFIKSSKNCEVLDNLSFAVKKNKVTNKEYVCHICGKIITGSNNFKSHLNRHIKGKSYQCQYCARKFSHICSLKYHTRTHTGETPYTCKICSKAFKSLSNLKKHLAVHSHLRLFKCTICSTSFKNKFNQQIHIKRHLSQPHTCKVCRCIFESRKSLAAHIRRKHKDQKMFACQDCGKSYQYQCLLNQHKKVHTNERNHACRLCNASFVWRSGLASHLKTHSFKLQCEICSRKFTSLKKLDKHRSQHADPLPHKCNKCQKEFKYAYLLKNHLTRHKDELMCTICHLGFINKTKLKRHIKNHSDLNKSPQP